MTRMESVVSKNKINLSIDGRDIILFGVSYLLGCVSILDRLYPFGIAFLGAYIIFRTANIAILLGTIVGILTSKGLGGFSYYLSAILIYGFFTIYKDNKKYSLVVASIIVATIFTIVRLIEVNILQIFMIYDIILVTFEGILVFTMTYIFSFSFPIEDLGKKDISNEKMICSFITIALILSGFNNISIFEASVKNIVCILLILFLSYNQGIYLGAITGIILGMVSYISNVEMPFIIAILSAGGMLSGLFKELGKFGAIIGFAIGNVIISYYINTLGTSFLSYKELFISSLLFLILYNRFEQRIDSLFKPLSKTKRDFENRKFELASKKLSSMSELLQSIALTYKNSVEEKDVFSSSEIYSIIDDISINKCKSCENYNKCWKDEYYTTYYSLFTVMGILETPVEDKDNLILAVIENCKDADDLALIVNDSYNKYKEKEVFSKRLKEQKMVLIEQLEGLSKVVNGINLDIYKTATFNEELEELLEKEIKNKRIDIRELIVAELSVDNMEIYLEFDSYNTFERVELVTKVVSNALGFPVIADYNFGSIEHTNRFKLIRTNRYGSLTKVSELTCIKDGVSGDNFTYGESENTSFAAICDGMGTGDKANLESKIAIEILEKMMEMDIDKEMIIKTINSVLRTKANDEIFTTLDLTFVDLYKGKLQVMKSGAPPTFIKRKDQVIAINSLSLPIGILENVDFNIYEEHIEDGDLIIMMSDGVLECNQENDAPEAWMKRVIEELKAQSPQAIAEEILDIAKLSSHNETKDDMTVLVTKIWKNNN